MRKFGGWAGPLSPKPCARAKTQKLGRAMSSRKWTAASSSTAPPAERTTFGETIKTYIKEVTEKRPGEASRAAEKSRLERFMRDEPKLCAYAVAHLRPEHFEDYRDRRLTEFVTRGKPGGRGQYKPEKAKPPGRFRKDGTPRANAAEPKAPPKPPKKVEPGTVKRELTVLKRVIDHSKRKLGLLTNPINTEDVKRPVVNDERDVRLEDEQIDALIQECYQSKNPWVGPIVDFAFDVGSRRGNLSTLALERCRPKGTQRSSARREEFAKSGRDYRRTRRSFTARA